MIKIIQFTFIFLSINAFSQYNIVPFRVGDLFGISNINGKTLIKPQFDIIEVSTYDVLYFTGFIIKGNKITSSLIYNNQIILNNKDYNTYHYENELFQATKYIVNEKVSNFSENKVNNIVHLYDKNGKAIISEDCSSIGVLENADEKKISNEVLVYFQTTNKKSSLFLYNKKLKKITNYYFQNSNFLKIDYNEDYDYRDKSINFIYVDQENKGKKLTVLQDSKGVKKIAEVDFEIKRNNDYEDDYYRTEVAVLDDEDNRKPIIISNDSISYDIGEVEIAREFYFNPKKIEQIKILPKKLSSDWSYIIKKNDKIGLRLTQNNNLLIPIAYDEILDAEINGQNSCFLVKQNNKYGAYINAYNEKERFIIEPVFSGKFLILDINYFGDKNPLLKIYDENGIFYCYAKKDGTLFIK